jgi:uncharacterized protein
MQPIAAYDTNILLSSIGWGGTPYRALELARQGRVEGLTPMLGAGSAQKSWTN